VRQLIEEKKVYILCSCAERLPVGDVRVVGLDALDLVPVKTLNTTYIYLLEDEKADQVLELKTGKEKMHFLCRKFAAKSYLMNRLYADGTLCRFSGAVKLDWQKRRFQSVCVFAKTWTNG
jgi:hypothetical protein